MVRQQVSHGSATPQGLLQPVPLSAQGQGVPGPLPIARSKRTNSPRQSQGTVSSRQHLHLRWQYPDCPQSLQILSHLQPQVRQALSKQTTGT